MAPKMRWHHERVRKGWIGLAMVMALMVLLATVSVALAYETGPVIKSDWLAPSAPFTANQPYETGPVVKSDWLAPSAPFTGNQPYETGPVIKSDWLAPSAPFTANQQVGS